MRDCKDATEAAVIKRDKIEYRQEKKVAMRRVSTGSHLQNRSFGREVPCFLVVQSANPDHLSEASHWVEVDE